MPASDSKVLAPQRHALHFRPFRARRDELLPAADERWNAVLVARPELRPAVELQRRLLELRDRAQRDDRGRTPAATVAAGQVSRRQARPRRPGAGRRADSAAGGRPDRGPSCSCAASSPRAARARSPSTSARRSKGAASTPARCSRPRCPAIRRPSAPVRCIAAWRPISSGWSPSLPSARSRTRCSGRSLPARPARRIPMPSRADDPLTDALHRWHHGYCPACGSWPAMAEVVDGHRILRCSFCATAWELTTYACVYCGEDGEPFVTAAPDEERKDRRVEVCSSCGGYLKTVDTAALSPFPLLADWRSGNDGPGYGGDGARLCQAGDEGVRATLALRNVLRVTSIGELTTSVRRSSRLETW